MSEPAFNNQTCPHIYMLNCLDDENCSQYHFGGRQLLYFRAIVDLILTMLVIYVNIFLILSIVLYRRRFRGTPKLSSNSGISMKFVLLLAFSDVLIGVAVLIYHLSHYFCTINEYLRISMFLCITKYFMLFFSSLMSNLSLTALAVDRYLAIYHTLKYPVIMTHRRCHIIMLTVFILSIVPSGVLYFWNYWKKHGVCETESVIPYTYMLVLSIPCRSSVLVSVAVIHVKVHRKAAESASFKKFVDLGKSRYFSRSMKTAKCMVKIAGIFIICWSMFNAGLLIRTMFAKTRFLDFMYQTTFSLYYYTNSLSNPFVYAWKIKEVNTAINWFIKRLIKLQ